MKDRYRKKCTEIINPLDAEWLNAGPDIFVKESKLKCRFSKRKCEKNPQKVTKIGEDGNFKIKQTEFPAAQETRTRSCWLHCAQFFCRKSGRTNYPNVSQGLAKNYQKKQSSALSWKVKAKTSAGKLWSAKNRGNTILISSQVRWFKFKGNFTETVLKRQKDLRANPVAQHI